MSLPALRRPEAVRQRWLALLLAFALVLTQSMGALHPIVHAGHATGPGLSFSKAPAGSHPADGDRWMQRLLAGHDLGHGCDLFDQAAHGDVAFGAPLAPPTPAATTEPIQPHASWHLATQARGALARGPPATA